MKITLEADWSKTKAYFKNNWSKMTDRVMGFVIGVITTIFIELSLLVLIVYSTGADI